MKKCLILLCLAAMALPGCLDVKVEPIHVTADVNLNVKVDKDIDSSFTQSKTTSGVLPQDLHNSFLQRRPALEALRASGVARENNQGFVELNGGDDKAAQIVKDENDDRTKAFDIIAQKDGITADEVGRERAKKIAEKAKPGVWLQSPDGTWGQKQ
jgi:uncharacterized protein YdbL (DUF1318 family)